MWKPIYHPGPWLQFLQRKDNVGVPLMEVRKKYLVEELQFDSINSTDPNVSNTSNTSNAGNPLDSIPSIRVVNSPSGTEYEGVYQKSVAESLGIRKNGTVAWARLEYSVPKGGGAPVPTGNYFYIQWKPQFSKWQVRKEVGPGAKVVPFLSTSTTNNLNPFGQYTRNNLGVISTLEVENI